MSFPTARILITGAAGGIGSCVARRLAGAGAKLLLTDVRSGPLSVLNRAVLRVRGTELFATELLATLRRGRFGERAAVSGEHRSK